MEALVPLDGYDVIEALATQDRVDDVALVDGSRAGLTD
jgi:hypothetical protein